ncbi:hypothetical protein [Deinococcus soli (ex Cha et al. 2016)]|uniref:Uncharacterized protein n=2 Tax=Deinococcus soli (ex Cha et al. 2016) TaxID=1309411 RepID=A0AAE3XDU0_9DEIO|nr:hypothetical protein [Deinococcus soli (ex Cha et al. 2016)]MDR6219211.1 hypothetical protein [Deinococcus soli (ex Cha et al. 2016)]MDR6329460.1 hypothetical protein [Deinococcus soli (ex Cha et al. 2016)]MDR6752120.1 hypothetical protein [Deinococcus soli (ex Cha et al. 2016)]
MLPRQLPQIDPLSCRTVDEEVEVRPTDQQAGALTTAPHLDVREKANEPGG